MAIRESAENLLREFHRHGADAYRAACDRSFGAHFLGHVEGALEELVQKLRRRPGTTRRGVGFLHLAKDFRLTEHHGIQPADDSEKMPDRRRRIQADETIAIRRCAARGHDITHRRKAIRGRFRGHVKLHPITRRDHDRFLHTRRRPKQRSQRGNLTIRDGEFLAQLDGCGVVIEAEAKDFHN